MNRKGFTLIEVLVAMVVLSVALLAIVQMNIIYVKANTYNHQLSAATIFAQEKMEELRGYARSDRADKFSPFDFDFMLNTDNTFTSVVDTDITAAATVIPGLASNNGVIELDNGTTYATMTAAGGAFTATDTPTPTGTAAAFEITRTWTVTPLNVFDAARADYAHLVVTSTWTDQYGNDRNVTIESITHRRQ